MPSIYEAQLFSQETDAGETETIIRKLRWMTYARLAVFVFLGGATAVFGVETIHPNEARFVVGHFRPVDATDLVLFFTAGAGCTLTLLYAFALRFVRSLKNLKRLAHFQIMADAVFAAIMGLLTCLLYTSPSPRDATLISYAVFCLNKKTTSTPIVTSYCVSSYQTPHQ